MQIRNLNRSCLESKTKQDAEFKNEQTNMGGIRHTQQRATPEAGTRTCWWSGLVWDLCTCIAHLQLGAGGKEKENASSNKLRNYIQIYSTKIMHL